MLLEPHLMPSKSLQNGIGGSSVDACAFPSFARDFSAVPRPCLHTSMSGAFDDEISAVLGPESPSLALGWFELVMLAGMTS